MTIEYFQVGQHEINTMLQIDREYYPSAGWYYWPCEPGCLPDSDPVGPFDSLLEAVNDSNEGLGGYIQVVPYTYHYHAETGRKASIFGSAPIGDGWETVTKGYTWEVCDHNGSVTRGLCRSPVETVIEAMPVAIRYAINQRLTVAEPVQIGE